MEFRLLGPLEVWRDGHSIEVRGSKRRAVLALLALHANEVVRRDRLIDELWGERPPANAAAALQNHVSRLRKDLGAEVVATKPWGYVLRAEPERIDVARFESLVADARPLPARERREKLGEALGLWRGPAVADLVHEPALELEAERLEELRLAALEHRIDADLELGAHEDLVPELEALVARHPLRERLRGQLILALYRCGRQAEALETYRETRRLLVEELGIEPGAELRELERAILTQDPALATSAAQPAPAPVPAAPQSERWRWPRSPLALGIAVLALGALGTASAFLWPGGSTQPSLAAAGPEALADWPVVFQRPSGATVTTVTQVTVRNGRTGTTTTFVHRPHGGVSGQAKGAGGGAGTGTAAVTTVGKTVAQIPHQPPAPPPPPPPPPPPVVPPPPPVVTADGFGDGVIDPRLWDVERDGPLADADEREGSLEVAFGGKTPFVTPGPFVVGVSTRCRFVGDFEAVVDYRLLDWSQENGVIAMLQATFSGRDANPMSIGRASLAGDAGDGYVSFAPPGWSQRRASADQRGSLRMTRAGETLTTYYRDGGTWRRLYGFKRSLGAPGGVGPVTLSLQLFSPREAFGWRSTRVAFDNFFVAAQGRRCS